MRGGKLLGVAAAVVLMSCGGEPTRVAGPEWLSALSPSITNITETVEAGSCSASLDIVDNSVTFAFGMDIDACANAVSSGYDDQLVTLEFTHDGKNELLGVYEHSYVADVPAGGTAGYGIRRLGLFRHSASGARVDSTYSVSWRAVREIAGTKIMVFAVQDCSPGASDEACWSGASTAQPHDELYVCVDNMANSVFSDGALYTAPRYICANAAQAAGSGPMIDALNHLPTVDFGPGSFLVGSAATLVSQVTDDPGDTFTYKWSIGAQVVATTPNLVHTFPAIGTYVVRLSVMDQRGGVGVRLKTVTVLSNAISVTLAAPPSPVYANSSVTVAAQATGGTGSYASFRWYRNGTLVQNSANNSYTANSGTSDYTLRVEAIDTQGSIGTSAVATVTVLPYEQMWAAIAGPNNMRYSTTCTLTASTTGGPTSSGKFPTQTTYDWYNDAGVHLGTGPTLNVTSGSGPGAIIVYVTAQRGPESDTAGKTILVSQLYAPPGCGG